MLRVQKVKVDDIYVPTARRKTLHPETVRHLAEDILENGMKTPIQVGTTASAMSWSKGCIGWRPPNGSARPRSTPIWCRRDGTDSVRFAAMSARLHHGKRSHPIKAF
nr:hypothetical protein [Mesorhizobium sp.]